MYNKTYLSSNINCMSVIYRMKKKGLIIIVSLAFYHIKKMCLLVRCLKLGRLRNHYIHKIMTINQIKSTLDNNICFQCLIVTLEPMMTLK